MDWMNQLTVIELGPNILGFIPGIFEQTLLKSSDAAHLASAFWIRDLFRLRGKYGPRGSTVTFTTSHRSLLRAAAASNLETFNPQLNQLA
jgi:hypothetical protein